jgi:hypothetical protein
MRPDVEQARAPNFAKNLLLFSFDAVCAVSHMATELDELEGKFAHNHKGGLSEVASGVGLIIDAVGPLHPIHDGWFA